MGILDLIFGGGGSGGGRQFRFATLTEAKRSLYEELHQNLSEEQRQSIMEILQKSSVSGGVTFSAVEGSVHRALRRLHDTHELSSFEFEAIMRWLREKPGGAV